ncbi:BH0509 family protein [Listeria monocytogenes]|nr:BH0509 family protein [Listeria monocytogenes]EAG7268092.1 BH0509 family protein [Listeria monocytogenes]EAG7292403.1 BH0509 family protein [Listeria monocytogenes]EAG7358948.1 BH0509 family protein [Listeria monocytogenes]EAH1987232.1 BH0509 family protein [Listeria monocytogenes]
MICHSDKNYRGVTTMEKKDRNVMIEAIKQATSYELDYLITLSDREIEVIYETRVIEECHN